MKVTDMLFVRVKKWLEYCARPRYTGSVPNIIVGLNPAPTVREEMVAGLKANMLVH